jgi:cell division transport system permease protein
MNALTLALTTIRRTPYQALSAMLIVTITFFMGFSFSVLGIWGSQVIKYAQSQQEIIAFFADGTTPEEIAAVEKTMRGKSYIKTLTIETQQQALENYLRDNANSPLLTDLVTAEMLPASIAVSAQNIASLDTAYADLQAQPGIEDVTYQEQVTKTLQSWIHSLEVLGAAVVSLLALSSFLTIMVLTALKATTQKYAIKVMRLIGATKWYIKSPFMIEGILYGAVGSVLGWALMYLTILYLTPTIQQFQGDIAFVPVPLTTLLIQLAGGVGLGMFLGGFAGLSAVNRLIRR